ncbi:hypothetical protein GW17_00027886 [Ensete ventricosum]|nr:hypothetical protein GW17_00027886 [Ensete ventricosum]RZR98477.1 hypothetical protein BHM03_00027828 [Ensete ventricosum]
MAEQATARRDSPFGGSPGAQPASAVAPTREGVVRSKRGHEMERGIPAETSEDQVHDQQECTNIKACDIDTDHLGLSSKTQKVSPSTSPASGEEEQRPYVEPPVDARKDEYSWITLLSFAFLTYNSVTTAYRSIHDLWALSFVVVAYVDLLSLFWCLRQFEKSKESHKGRLKVAVWFLTALLTTMFSYKVASVMPRPVAVIVWCLGSTTIIGGFYAFFVYRELPPIRQTANGNKI